MPGVRLLHQPLLTPVVRVADEIRRLLGDRRFSRFLAFSAYVRSSGVVEIENELRAFGGTKVVFAGINNGVTTAQGLELLLACGTTVHRVPSSPVSLFHPKGYFFEGPSVAVGVVGSANLTASAFLNNVELCALIEWDLTNPGDTADYATVAAAARFFSSSSPAVASTGDISALLIANEVENEALRAPRASKGRGRGKSASGLSVKSAARRSTTFKSVFGAPPKPTRAVTSTSAAIAARGPLLWRKNSLSRSDAQLPHGRSNPTGNLKLSQGGFKVAGRLIDQKTYFRANIFASLPWIGPVPETAPLPVRLTIRGLFVGAYVLHLSYDRARVAGQGNTPTWLHWGNATPVLTAHKVDSLSLEIYGPDALGVYDIVIG